MYTQVQPIHFNPIHKKSLRLMSMNGIFDNLFKKMIYGVSKVAIAKFF